MTFDVEGTFSASQKSSWRMCAGKRPAISASVHHMQDQIAVSRFSNSDYCMAELEEEVRVRNGNAAHSGKAGLGPRAADLTGRAAWD
jgi:hypothetical protein